MRVIFGVLALLLVVSPSFAQARRGSQPSPRFTQRVQREVMHRILMLPYYDVFDVISFKVEGYDVTLTGKVTRPTLKDDAARVVQKIEGVEHVNNRIEVLPLLFFDDSLRLDEFRAIY